MGMSAEKCNGRAILCFYTRQIYIKILNNYLLFAEFIQLNQKLLDLSFIFSEIKTKNLNTKLNGRNLSNTSKTT